MFKAAGESIHAQVSIRVYSYEGRFSQSAPYRPLVLASVAKHIFSLERYNRVKVTATSIG